METTIMAPAKLNLFLDIVGRRDDGYHFVDMVMQSVTLYDRVSVSINQGDRGISIECSAPDIPCDDTNTAYKAVELFYCAVGRSVPQVSISIEKNIPSQAGMAGGSTDAAAVLKALNELENAGLSADELRSIAGNIGADVPFCIEGGTVRATGIGTDLERLSPLADCAFAIVKPEISVSTGKAYRLSDEVGYGSPADIGPVLDGIASGSIEAVAGGLYNKFEDVLDLPEIESIKSLLIANGALGALMTGSGSAVFGIFRRCDLSSELISRMKKQMNVMIAYPEK